MKRKGFTLIELFVVICIVAILVAIVAPVFFRKNTKVTQVTVSKRDATTDNTYFIVTPTGEIYDLYLGNAEENALTLSQMKEGCTYSIRYRPKTDSSPAKITHVIAEIGCK
jgi:prepilin-type N-terminal cleavage/methylation domain-containing protein